MPKKKEITGKTKLSKLQHKEKEPLELVTSRKERTLPKSYRLKESDLQSLRKIVQNINKMSPSRVISETEVVRALIEIGTRLKPEKILNAYRDIFFSKR